MSTRYHLPVVITGDNELTRAEAIDYVEAVLSNLEDTEMVHRTYVEEENVDEGEAKRLLDMLDRLSNEDIAAAIKAAQELSSDEENL